MALLEGLAGGAIVALLLRDRNGREVAVPVQIPGDGQVLPIPLPVVIQPGLTPPQPSLVSVEAKELTMDTARAISDATARFNIRADWLYIWTDGDYSDVQIRLHNSQNDPIPANRLSTVPGPFETFYITHSAQAGKTLWYAALRNPMPGLAMSPPTSVSVVAVQKRQFARLRSDKDSHFTGALLTNAKEDESITGLASNKIIIRRIVAQSDQNLHYRALLWRTDGFDNTDLDLDTFAGEVDLDFPAIGFRIAGANQYYVDLECELEYQDSDASRELHISLLNQDATAKNAGATGEIAIEVYYEEAQ